MNPIQKYLAYLESQVVSGDNLFVAPGAIVIGKVVLGNNVSIWYNAVLRADFDRITIDDNTNVQDGVVMHVDEETPIHIGKNCIIGHRAIVHGCTIGDNTLIGMGATVMNRAVIGRGCVIGANTLVTEDMQVPDYSMVLGSPGKITKQLPPIIDEMVAQGAETYRREAAKYLGLLDYDEPAMPPASTSAIKN